MDYNADEWELESKPAAAPAAQAPAPAEDNPDDWELESAPKQQMGALETGRRALAYGLRGAGSEMKQSTRFAAGQRAAIPEVGKPRDPQIEPYLEQGVSEGYNDLNWWIANLAEMTGRSTPSLAGAAAGAVAGSSAGPVGTLVGGAAGAGLTQSFQALGHSYQDALARGRTPDEAFEDAWAASGIEGAGAALGAAIPGLRVFGRDAAGAAKAPIKELVAHVFGLQPGVAEATMRAERAATGQAQPTLEESAKNYILGVGQGVGFEAPHLAFDINGWAKKSVEQAIPTKGAPLPGLREGQETKTTAPAPEIGRAEQAALQPDLFDQGNLFDKLGPLPEQRKPGGEPMQQELPLSREQPQEQLQMPPLGTTLPTPREPVLEGTLEYAKPTVQEQRGEVHPSTMTANANARKRARVAEVDQAAKAPAESPTAIDVANDQTKGYRTGNQGAAPEVKGIGYTDRPLLTQAKRSERVYPKVEKLKKRGKVALPEEDATIAAAVPKTEPVTPPAAEPPPIPSQPEPVAPTGRVLRDEIGPGGDYDQAVAGDAKQQSHGNRNITSRILPSEMTTPQWGNFKRMVDRKVKNPPKDASPELTAMLKEWKATELGRRAGRQELADRIYEEIYQQQAGKAEAKVAAPADEETVVTALPEEMPGVFGIEGEQTGAPRTKVRSEDFMRQEVEPSEGKTVKLPKGKAKLAELNEKYAAMLKAAGEKGKLNEAERGRKDAEPIEPSRATYAEEVATPTRVKGPVGETDALESTTLGKVLDDFAGDYRRPFDQFIAKTLKNFVGDTPVHIVAKQDNIREAVGQRAPGAHIPGRGGEQSKIFFAADVATPRHVLHEGMHAWLQDKLDKNEHVRRQVTALADYVLKSMLAEGEHSAVKEYAFKDAHEFISVAIEKPSFQDYLRELPLPKELAKILDVEGAMKRMSAWDGFVEWARQLMKFKGPRSALEGVMAAVERLEREKTPSPSARESAEMSAYEVANAVRRPSPNLKKGEAAYSSLSDYWAAQKQQLTGVAYAEKARSEKALDKAKAMLLAHGVSAAKADKLLIDIGMQAKGPLNWTNLRPQIEKLVDQHGTIQRVTGQPGGEKYVAAQKANAEQRRPAGQPSPQRPPSSILKTGPKSEAWLAAKEANVDMKARIQRLQEITEEAAGRQLDDELAFFDKSRLANSRIQHEQKQVDRTLTPEAEAINRDAQAAGFTDKEIAEMIMAPHAKERNAALKAREGVENGTGMSDAKAEAILKDPKKKPFIDRMQKFAKRAELLAQKIGVEGDLATQEEYDALNKLYKNYVPLKGWTDAEIRAAMGEKADVFSGQGGVGLYGREYGKAEGRETIAENPFVYMIERIHNTIARAETNNVRQSLADAIVTSGMTKDKHGVYVAESISQTPATTPKDARQHPNILAFRQGGKEKYIVFKDEKIAAAFRRTSPDQLPGALKYATSVLNMEKSMWTRMSPTFLERHFGFRYPAEAAVNLQALRDYPGAKGQVDANPVTYLKEAFTSIPDVHRYLTGQKTKNPEVGKWMARMEKAGGLVSFKELTATRSKLRQRFETIGDDKASIKSRMKALGDYLNDWETAMDAAERWPIFKRMVEAGHSDQTAAIACRDITVDFERRGSKAAILQQWLPFATVALQTTGKMARTILRSKAGRRTFAAIGASAVAIEMANYHAGGEDENGVPAIEDVPAHERIQNVVVINPWKPRNDDGSPNYGKLPLPYPLFAPWTIMSSMVQIGQTLRGQSKLSKGAIGERVLGAMMESLTPLGSVIHNPIELFVPELLRPAYELATNENWLGHYIHRPKEWGPLRDKKTKQVLPKAEQGMPNTDQFWKDVAGGLHKVGIEVFPEDVKHVGEHFAGGAGKFFASPAKAIIDTARGKPPSLGEAFKSPIEEQKKLVVGTAKKADANRSVIYNLEAEEKAGGHFTPRQAEAIKNGVAEYRKTKPDQKPAKAAALLRKFKSLQIEGGRY